MDHITACLIGKGWSIYPLAIILMDQILSLWGFCTTMHQSNPYVHDQQWSSIVPELHGCMLSLQRAGNHTVGRSRSKWDLESKDMLLRWLIHIDWGILIYRFLSYFSWPIFTHSYYTMGGKERKRSQVWKQHISFLPMFWLDLVMHIKGDIRKHAPFLWAQGENKMVCWTRNLDFSPGYTGHVSWQLSALIEIMNVQGLGVPDT